MGGGYKVMEYTGREWDTEGFVILPPAGWLMSLMGSPWGCWGFWTLLRPATHRTQRPAVPPCGSLMPAKPLSYCHTNIQLCYSHTHPCLSYFQGGPRPLEETARRALMSPNSFESQLSDQAATELFEQEKGITHVGH